MVQHISVRVPWHDSGWQGNVCNDPSSNMACLKLKNIMENRDDSFECGICGQCMAEQEEKLPCIGEGGAFMSAQQLHKTTVHPYKQSNAKTHGHFLPTEIIYPPYSFPARPFAWLMRQNIEILSNTYGIDYHPEVEPVLEFKTNWIQEASNHRAVFDYFYSDIIPDQSLCIAYAKQVPFVEDNRRVIIGMGHVKRIVPAPEHKHTNAGKLRSMIWETMVCHSIREDHKDGFVIPYQQMMKYAENHPEFDMASITVFAPDDAFAEFSYATEHLSYDSVIDVILRCIKVFTIINECLDEDYSNVLTWLNEQLDIVWEDRGAFPGLGPMLSAFGIQLGIPMAREIKNSFDISPLAAVDDVVGRQQMRGRDGDGADFVQRQHRYPKLVAAPQHEHDAVPPPDTQLEQVGRRLVRHLFQVPEGEAFFLPLVIGPQQRQLVRRLPGPYIHNIIGEVEMLRHIDVEMTDKVLLGDKFRLL